MVMIMIMVGTSGEKKMRIGGWWISMAGLETRRYGGLEDTMGKLSRDKPTSRLPRGGAWPFSVALASTAASTAQQWLFFWYCFQCLHSRLLPIFAILVLPSFSWINLFRPIWHLYPYIYSNLFLILFQIANWLLCGWTTLKVGHSWEIGWLQARCEL